MKKYIAFDFFDTIVHRRCHPEQVLIDWAREVSLLLKFQFSPSFIYKFRKKIEERLKKEKKLEEVAYNILIKELYDFLSSKYDISIPFNEFYKASSNIEFEIEKKNIFLDKNTINELKEYVKNNNEIILVSDFYLGHSFFDRILSYLDIKKYFSHIFISSDIGLRKSSGNLYSYILDKLGITCNQLIMIGDNLISDYEKPRAMGIHSIHKPYNNPYIFYSKRELENKLNGMLKSINNSNLFNGYIPALILFADRLYKKAIMDGAEVLLFCSREGENLKKLFDIYQKYYIGEDRIKTKYFYVSRRATLLPSLKNIESEEFHTIFRQYNELSIKDFLYSIGFDYSDIKKLLIKKDISENSIISDSKDCSLLSNLRDGNDFLSLYNKGRNDQKEFFIEYCKQLTSDKLSKLYIVDIGWKGSIQDNIFNALDRKVDIQGYYLGLFSKGLNQNKGNIKNGLMFDDSNINIDYDIYTFDYINLELVFSASHGQVLKYRKENNKIIPVKSQDNKDIEVFNYIKPWQSIMNDSFRDVLIYCKMSNTDISDLEKFFTKLYVRNICMIFPLYPTLFKEAKGKIKENFGNISSLKLKYDKQHSRDRRLKARFYFMSYVYKFIDKFHLRYFSLVARVYSYIVYTIKKIKISIF